jgi:hypothetical protein
MDGFESRQAVKLRPYLGEAGEPAVALENCRPNRSAGGNLGREGPGIL